MLTLAKSAEIFVIYIAALLRTPIYLSRKDQIRTLSANKTLTKVPVEYLDYVDVLLLDLVIELPKHTDINNHTINLIEYKQAPYSSIYSLPLVELETSKNYIKIYLKTGFIWSSKSRAYTPIFFN